MTGFFVVLLLAFMRFFFPRTLTEPKTKFKIGTPADFGFGVDTKFQSSNRIWVVRNAEGLFVILAKCTHLGCTPDWKESENKFKCPCHGSGFTSEGINFEGPAPRPLDRCHVELDPEGQIVVDSLRLYARDQFRVDGAMLRV
ncbi:MAG: Rieske 2Fe-2S domain-containing protein [Planctomycetes bacterium]|nr:Rieske 2Fe-2S domain-containing protein [Planctomycetota bacterium]